MPFGIIVLALLYLVLGSFHVLWGAAVTGVGSLSWLSGLLFSSTMREWGGSAFWGGVWGIGGGILQLVTGIGLFARQRWALALAWVSAAISFIGPLVSLLGGNIWALFGLIIPGIILFYLTTNQHVKRSFARS